MDLTFDPSRDGLLALDARGCCAWASARAGELLQRAPAALIGLPLSALPLRGAAELERQYHAAPVRGFAESVVTSAGDRPLQVQLQPVSPGALLRLKEESNTGEPPGAGQWLLDALPDVVVLTDGEGRVTQWNPAAERAFAYRAPLAPGAADAPRLVESRELLQAILASVAEKGDWCGDITRTSQGGERRIFETRVCRLESGTVSVSRDVTAQRAAEREQRAVLRAITEPLFVIDRHGRYCSIAASGEDLLFARPDELLGRTLLEVLPHPTGERLHAAVVDALERQVTIELEYELPIRGEPHWFLATISPMDGERVVWIARNITERQRAEQKLRSSKEQLQTFLDTIPDHAWMKDRDGRYQLANGAYLEAWNLTRENLVGRTDADLFPPDVAREFVATDAIVMNAGSRRTFEHALHDADGNRRWYEVVKAPLRGGDGRVSGTVGISRDITVRKETEEALREVEERFRQLAENIPQGFWISSTQDRSVVYLSPAFEQIWGGKLVLGERGFDEWLDTVHPEDQARVRRTYEQGTARAEPFEQVYRIVRPDGDVRWIQDRGFPVIGPEYTPYRFAGVAEDITEKRALEEQLRQSQKLEGVGRLAGGIAHDFNNMLLVIQGFATLLEAEIPHDGEARIYVREILDAAERSSRLTRQLLAYSRRQIMRTEVIDLNEVTRRLESMLRRMIGEDVVLTTELDARLPRVSADPTQLEQVIINLAVNARDAMPTGGRLLLQTQTRRISGDARGHAPPGVAEGTYVELSLQDTGTGMSQEVLAAAFEPFFTTKPVGSGTGLGLSMVYGIVKQSGGHVWAESVPGQGTTVHVLLPAARAEAEEPAPPSPAPSTTAEEGRILVVEDDAAVRRLLVRVLERAGFTVLGAENGAEARRLLQRDSGPVAVALIDVVLTGESGRSVAEQVRELSPQTAVVFMSGYTDDSLLRHGIEASQHRFLQKPIDAAVLLSTVRELLEPRG